MGWMSGYSKRKELVLTGGASGAQAAFQLDLAIAYATAMQGGFDDLRFTRADGTTLIDAWLESKIDSTSAKVTAEFPTTPANTVEQDYYMYYGNAGAASDWDIGNTFVFGDDAESGIYSDKWVDITGSGDYSTSEAHRGSKSVHLAGTNDGTIVSKDINVSNCVFEAMVKNVGFNNYYTHLTARASQTAKTYYSYRPHYTGNVAELYKRVAGSWTSLDSDASTDSVTTWHKWSILCNGTSIKTYFDDALRNEATDSSIASGGIGIRQVPSNNMYLDDVRIRKYAANPPTYAFGSEESVPIILRNPSMGGGMV